MAELTRYAKSHLSNIETGQSNVSADIITKYEEILGLERGVLLSGQGGETSPSRTRPIGDTMPPAPTNPESLFRFRDSLPTVVFANLIAQSKHRIWILENWVGDDLRNLAGSFLDADRRGVEIKIAILQENSPFSEQRTAELRLGSDLRPFDSNLLILENKRFLGQWLKETQHMEVKTHSSLPSIQIIIIDDTAEVGFYFHGQTSRGGPQLVVPIHQEGSVTQYTTLGFYLEKEFEYVWSKAAAFNPE